MSQSKDKLWGIIPAKNFVVLSTTSSLKSKFIEVILHNMRNEV